MLISDFKMLQGNFNEFKNKQTKIIEFTVIQCTPICSEVKLIFFGGNKEMYFDLRQIGEVVEEKM